jgi:hypothetical protein
MNECELGTAGMANISSCLVVGGVAFVMWGMNNGGVSRRPSSVAGAGLKNMKTTYKV